MAAKVVFEFNIHLCGNLLLLCGGLSEGHHGGGEDVENCKARCASPHCCWNFASDFWDRRSCRRLLLDWWGMFWYLVWNMGKIALTWCSLPFCPLLSKIMLHVMDKWSANFPGQYMWSWVVDHPFNLNQVIYRSCKFSRASINSFLLQAFVSLLFAYIRKAGFFNLAPRILNISWQVSWRRFCSEHCYPLVRTSDISCRYTHLMPEVSQWAIGLG